MKRLIMTLAAVSFALLTSAASASAADGDADGIDDSVDNCAGVSLEQSHQELNRPGEFVGMT